MGLLERIMGLAFLAAIVAAGADFMEFVGRADRLASPATPPAVDGVAVLTGASDARIAAGVEVSRALGAPLLISGVHPSATASDIAAIAGVEVNEIICCATLGRAAASTIGNGEEIAGWAREKGLASLLVVTSDYHMDRALLELGRAMPEAELSPYPVASGPVRPSRWYTDGSTARRFLSEWAKFRTSTLFGPSALSARTGGDAGASPGAPAAAPEPRP